MLTTFFVGFGMLATPAVKALSGAIYTTTAPPAAVNANQYLLKADVYLQGGPSGSNPTAAQIVPDGFYYCQVTTPNGGVLGKTLDDVIEVSGGHFVQSYQLINILYTASSGFTTKGFDDTTNNGGEYKVWISADPSFPNSESKTDNFKVEERTGPPEEPDPDPEDPKAELCVIKFYDSNANGIKDDGEVEINDWLVSLNGPISLDPLVTSLVLATPSCTFVTPGDFTVTELDAVESHWIHTTPAVQLVTLIESTPIDHFTAEFGNVCIGAGGGKTLGFWSNKNGRALVGVDDLGILEGLNLKNADGSDFTFGATLELSDYGTLRYWLLNGKAVNMSYMLSVQLAAMALNNHNGLLSGSIVYAPELMDFSPPVTPPALAPGFISIIDLIAAANAELGLGDGKALAGDPRRAYQEALKDAIDDANNNLNFVEPVFDPVSCPFSFATP